MFESLLRLRRLTLPSSSKKPIQLQWWNALSSTRCVKNAALPP